jgi:probable HAF family extracellular repeat protein
MRRVFVPAALAGVAFTLPAAPSALPADGCAARGLAKYRPIDLGTLGGTWSVGRAINDAGQIAGSSTTASGEWHAFLWAHGVMTDLGEDGFESRATAINDAGQVVGTRQTPDGWRAFLWRDGTRIDLGWVDGHPITEAWAINAAGQVAGRSSKPSAVLWDRGTATDLGGDRAVAINPAGRIVGYAMEADELRTCLWDRGGMVDLGRVPPAFSMGSGTQRIINAAGQVAGVFDNGGDHAFLWDHGEMTDLGTLGGGYSFATAINAGGAVAGTSAIPGSHLVHAFVWRRGTMIDLGALSPGGSSGAVDINAAGLIAGWAESDGVSQAIVWDRGQAVRLEPPPGAAAAMAVRLNAGGDILGRSWPGSSAWERAVLWLREEPAPGRP